MEDANYQPVSLGSGIFVRDGIVATNFHVVEDSFGGYAKEIGKKAKYQISGTVGIDRNVDLVLLAIEGVKAPSLPLGDSETVQIGDEIYAVGNPLGLEGTFSKGIISGIRKVGSIKLFQITAPISPGSSGGAILNSSGQVIGVSVATFREGQNLNFAIPVSYLSSLLHKPTDITSLQKLHGSKKRKSIFESFGKRGQDGVIARKFGWSDKFSIEHAYYHFSLYNRLRKKVTSFFISVIFYDEDGLPIDNRTYHCCYHSGVGSIDIPPGLAYMETGRRTSIETKKLTKKVEVRVLDFKIND
jgi:hypothetical protein